MKFNDLKAAVRLGKGQRSLDFSVDGFRFFAREIPVLEKVAGRLPVVVERKGEIDVERSVVDLPIDDRKIAQIQNFSVFQFDARVRPIRLIARYSVSGVVDNRRKARRAVKSDVDRNARLRAAQHV